MSINRIIPRVGAEAMQTYAIASPHDRTVRAACEQVGCGAWRHGWETTVDEATELGARQAAFIRTQAGRTFRELRTEAGLTVFRFDAGQRCFANHQTRPELYLVRGGDWRGNPAKVPGRQHANAADWVEDFGEHQQKVHDAREKG